MQIKHLSNRALPRALSPRSVSLLTRKLITRSSPRRWRRRRGGRRARGKTASCGTVTSLFFFCRDMKERRDSNDVSGIPPGKVEGLKGKMRALLVFIHPPFPLFLVALIKQGKERERERERESEGGRQRESLRSLP